MFKLQENGSIFNITIDQSFLDKFLSFRHILKKKLKEKDTLVNLDLFNEGIIKTNDSQIVNILSEYLSKDVAEQVINLMKNKVSIDEIFSVYPEYVLFSDICEYVEELELRNITLDFNSISYEKDIIGIDAGDRIKFISKIKFDFELSIEQLLQELKIKANNEQINEYIDNYIKNEIINKQSITDGDREFYFHIVDYFLSDYFKNEYKNYDALNGMSFSTVKNNVHKWSQNFTKNKVKDDLLNTKIVYQIDNYYWIQLTSPQSLDYESNLMGHCVGQGGYDSNVLSGVVIIYSLRDSKNEPHCTIELRNGKINQIKGKKNTYIVEKYRKAVVSFIVNYLNIPLIDLSESLLNFCLLAKKDNHILPSTFVDINHIKHFFIGKTKNGIEDVINQIVEAEADLFKYNVEEVKNMVIQSINKYLIEEPELLILIDKDEKKLIDNFIKRNINIFSIDYKPLELLNKLYAVSKYRQWAIEYLKPLLLRKKFENNAELILDFVDDFMNTFFNITLVDYIEEISNGATNLNIYQGNKIKHLEEYVFDNVIKNISSINNLSSLANIKSSIEVNENLGCEECNNESLVKDLVDYKSTAESMEDDINEKIDFFNKISSELEDISKEVEDFADEVVNDISYYYMEYLKNKDLIKAEESINQIFIKKNHIINWEDVVVSQSYGTKTISDIHNLMTDIENQIDQISDLERDFDKCLNNIDFSCPCSSNSKRSSQFYFPVIKFQDQFDKISELTEYLSDFSKNINEPKLINKIIELFFVNNSKILFSE
jgi:hypothetical protein